MLTLNRMDHRICMAGHHHIFDLSHGWSTPRNHRLLELDLHARALAYHAHHVACCARSMGSERVGRATAAFVGAVCWRTPCPYVLSVLHRHAGYGAQREREVRLHRLHRRDRLGQQRSRLVHWPIAKHLVCHW